MVGPYGMLNESLTRFVLKYYASNPAALNWRFLYGASIFDVGIEKLTSYRQDGCVCAGFLLRSAFSIDHSEVPKDRFVFGARVQTEEVCFIVYDIDARVCIHLEYHKDDAYWLMLSSPRTVLRLLVVRPR